MEHHVGIIVLTFVTVALLIGALTRHFLKSTNIPYTVALLLIGIVLALLERYEYLGASQDHSFIAETFDLISNIEPHLILFLFLPTLIFESAFALETHLFRRIFNQIAILAVPGLLVCTAATAVFAKFVFPWDWSWTVCFLFGALISATDPVAVVALLKEVSSRKRLETLIEGESLLNDGTAIVLFTVFMGILAATDGTSIGLGSVTVDFIKVVALGLAVGLAVAWLVVYWLGKVFNDPLIEITITIAAAYMVFIVAEGVFHVSGVVALVTLGVVLASYGRTKVSPEVAEFLHHFWEMMAFFANTIIFLLVGILMATRVNLESTEAWIMLGLLYLAITIIRGGSVALFTPILKRVGIGFNRQKAVVLTWGGLRGAVALALALVIAQEPGIPAAVGDNILFLTAGIVVLTIIINGSTMLPVLRWVGLDKLPPAKAITVNKANRHIHHDLQEYIGELKRDEFLQAVDWDVIQKEADKDFVDDEPEDQTKVAEEDLVVAFHRRLLEAERQSYWMQFEQGLLSNTATAKLVEAVEHALDGEPEIGHRDVVLTHWQTPALLNWFRNIPFLRTFAIKSSYSRMILGYYISRGFIKAQNDIAQYVEQLAPSKAVAEQTHAEIMQNKRVTYEKVEQIRSAFPEILAGMETNAATRAILNRERSIIHELLHQGVLDKPEAAKMIEKVESRMQALYGKPVLAAKFNPLQCLNGVSWLCGVSDDTFEKVSSSVEQRVYSIDDILVKQGSHTGALAIVARGTVELLVKDGDSERTVDIIGTGTVIGAMSVFTGTADTTAKAISPVEVLWISADKLKTLMSSDPKLAANLSHLLQ